MLHKIIGRLMKLLTRRGVLIEEQGLTYPGRQRRRVGRRAIAQAAAGGLVSLPHAFGPRAGQKVFTVQSAMPRDTAFAPELCADVQGFSLRAAVRCGADDRQALEQLCRCITRPTLANQRVQCNVAGQVVLKLRTAWHDGTTHIVMSPLEFMQCLAALVLRPRLHLIRFHGGAGAQREAARAGGAPRAGRRCRRVGSRRSLAQLRAPNARATELGPAAQACLRDRPRALPKLRRQALDHCGHWQRARPGGSSPTSDCRPGRLRGHRRAGTC